MYTMNPCRVSMRLQYRQEEHVYNEPLSSINEASVQAGGACIQ
jgi:hypothetical protein